MVLAKIEAFKRNKNHALYNDDAYVQFYFCADPVEIKLR